MFHISNFVRLNNHTFRQKIKKLWKFSMGEQTRVAVIDTGIDFKHPYFKDVFRKGIRIQLKRKWCSLKKQNQLDQNIFDYNGHGTHVCGIISGHHPKFLLDRPFSEQSEKNNIFGIAPKAQLFVIKILDDHGEGDVETLNDAIQWCIENQIDIINMSLGSNEEIEGLKESIDKAIQHNIIIIAAAGNDNEIDPKRNKLDYPARYPEVISVGAVDKTFTKNADFSSTGEGLDILAPGIKIISTLPNNAYGKLDGTSMATPFITGLCCLIISYRKTKNLPRFTPKQMHQLLTTNTIDIGKKGYDIQTGFGLMKPTKELFKEKLDDNLSSKKKEKRNKKGFDRSIIQKILSV